MALFSRTTPSPQRVAASSTPVHLLTDGAVTCGDVAGEATSELSRATCTGCLHRRLAAPINQASKQAQLDRLQIAANAFVQQRCVGLTDAQTSDLTSLYVTFGAADNVAALRAIERIATSLTFAMSHGPRAVNHAH